MADDDKIPFPDAGAKPDAEPKVDDKPVKKSAKADKPEADAKDEPVRTETPTEAEIEAVMHATPHNEAAAAAVDAGMDVKTANEMTAVGSNI